MAQQYEEPDIVRGMLSEDFILPEYSLVQRTSAEVASGAKPGHFWHSLRNTPVEAIKCIVLDIRSTRTRWGRDEILSEPPICASDDSASMQARDGTDCSACEFRCDDPWNRSPDERRGLCLKGYVLIALDLENDEPFILRVSGLSSLPIRELASGIKIRQARRKTGFAEVLLKSAEKTTRWGPAYVIQPQVLEYLSPRDAKELVPLATEFKALPTAPIAGMIEAPEREAEPPVELPFEAKAEAEQPTAKAQPPKATPAAPVARQPTAPPEDEEETVGELWGDLFSKKGETNLDV